MSPFLEFLTFRRMITPVIIQILFWLGVVGCVITGIVFIITGFITFVADTDLLGAALLQFVMGIVYVIIGPFIVRVYCEILILFFRIHETLNEIKDNTVKP